MLLVNLTAFRMKKTTNLCGHLLFHSSVDPALLAGGDDVDNKEDTSIAGVYDQDAESSAESNHNSVDPNKDDGNSSKLYVHSSRSQISIHSTNNET